MTHRRMRWLHVSYSRRFNGAHGLCGHVHQGRYQAVVLEDRRAVVVAVRYGQHRLRPLFAHDFHRQHRSKSPSEISLLLDEIRPASFHRLLLAKRPAPGAPGNDLWQLRSWRSWKNGPESVRGAGFELSACNPQPGRARLRRSCPPAPLAPIRFPGSFSPPPPNTFRSKAFSMKFPRASCTLYPACF